MGKTLAMLGQHETPPPGFLEKWAREGTQEPTTPTELLSPPSPALYGVGRQSANPYYAGWEHEVKRASYENSKSDPHIY